MPINGHGRWQCLKPSIRFPFALLSVPALSVLSDCSYLFILFHTSGSTPERVAPRPQFQRQYVRNTLCWSPVHRSCIQSVLCRVFSGVSIHWSRATVVWWETAAANENMAPRSFFFFFRTVNFHAGIETRFIGVWFIRFCWFYLLIFFFFIDVLTFRCVGYCSIWSATRVKGKKKLTKIPFWCLLEYEFRLWHQDAPLLASGSSNSMGSFYKMFVFVIQNGTLYKLEWAETEAIEF